MMDDDPICSEIFLGNLKVRENKYRQYFTPGAPALIEVSRRFYKDGLMKSSCLLPEYLDYYFTSLLWLRFVALKRKTCQSLTENENDFLTLTQTLMLNVPEPLLIVLSTYGVIETMSGETLIPKFPPLPERTIQNIGGHFGPVNSETHILYEEFPCLGVMAYAIMNALSNKPPGRYDSLVTFKGVQPNGNLLGYRPLGLRSDLAKSLGFMAGFSEFGMTETLFGTGFNYKFLILMSNTLASGNAWKMRRLRIMDLPLSGSQSQIVIGRPCPTDQFKDLAVTSNIKPTCLCKEPVEIFTAGIFFCTQLMKSDSEKDLLTWSMFPKIPNEWIQHKNCRRNLPWYYYQANFSGKVENADDLRRNIMDKLNDYI